MSMPGQHKFLQALDGESGAPWRPAGSRRLGTRRRAHAALAASGLILCALTTSAFASPGVAPTAADDATSPAHCGPGDHPEPGMQGEVPPGSTPAWDCGVRAVGYLPGANGTMAVAGHCAYTGVNSMDLNGLPATTSGGGGVRVIDVTNPAKPRVVKVLPTSVRELMAARVTPQRAILVTRRMDTQAQSGEVVGRDALVDVWNIKKCTDPKLIGTLRFRAAKPVLGDAPVIDAQGPAHILGLNPSATKVYGTLPLQEADITDLAHPKRWMVRDFNCTITNQFFLPYQLAPGVHGCEATEHVLPMQFPQYSHEPTFSPDGSRLYLGSQFPYPFTNDMFILDMTGREPRLVSETKEAPGHSIDMVTVKNRRYLLHSNEASFAGCIPDDQRPSWFGFGDRAFLLDITNEKAPKKVAQLALAASRFENCGRNGNLGGPTVAFHSVDNALDSTYAVIGYGPAGFRFFDLRNPSKPAEVAYFNHGASQHTKPYIMPGTGQIWVSDESGFWVLELEPHVRRQLGLPANPGHTAPRHAA